MTDTGRWRRIEDLCHAALERDADQRPAFLRDACAGDDTLRREVESLLGNRSEAERFLEVRRSGLGSKVSGLHLIGQRIGAYEIRSLLGAGGMGEVYRAHDMTLGRDVAVKVLPAMFTANPERLARFAREAHTLATLNHPHIGAIYGVEQSENVRALILELVEGPTLADRLANGPIAAHRIDRDRPANCRCAGGRARARDRPPGSEAGQHQDHARRHRQGARLRLGQGHRKRRTRPRCLHMHTP